MIREDDNVVAVIQPFVPSYRKGLFDAIAEELASHGLRLEVWHAQPRGRVAARGNATTGAWSVPIAQHRLSIGRRNVTFRPVLARARRVRAVIAGLASTNLETYALAADPRVRLMLWGHGKNFTASNLAIDAKLESWLGRRSKHVFTYTDEGKRHIETTGMASDRISVVLNSTDTTNLRAFQSSTTPASVQKLRDDLDLDGDKIGLFVGAFDEPKKLPFLFEAADLIYARFPDFRLVLAGAGPEQAMVEEAAAARPYARLVGRLEAPQLAEFSHLVDIVLMPGRVGLVAVDALALGLPIATTDYPFHAPEVAYLQDGINARWSRFVPEEYARVVGDLLDDRALLQALADGASRSGADFSVEKSAKRFVAGVLAGLDA